jgi:hypothetical protein
LALFRRNVRGDVLWRSKRNGRLEGTGYPKKSCRGDLIWPQNVACRQERHPPPPPLHRPPHHQTHRYQGKRRRQRQRQGKRQRPKHELHRQQQSAPWASAKRPAQPPPTQVPPPNTLQRSARPSRRVAPGKSPYVGQSKAPRRRRRVRHQRARARTPTPRPNHPGYGAQHRAGSAHKTPTKKEKPEETQRKKQAIGPGRKREQQQGRKHGSHRGA